LVHCEATPAALDSAMSSFPSWSLVHASLCAGAEGWSDKDRVACAFTAVRVATSLSRLRVLDTTMANGALEGLLRPTCVLLQTLQPAYAHSVVHNDDDGASEEEEGVAQLVAQVMELLQSMIMRPKLRGVLKKHTQQLLQLLVPFMQITEAQVRQWRADPNEFLAHEDDEHVKGCMVRLSGEGLVGELMEHIKRESARSLAMVTAELLEKGEQDRAAGEQQAWKLTELGLYLFSIVAGAGTVKSLQRGEMASLSPTAMRTAAAISGDTSAVDFLRARAFSVLHRMRDSVCASSPGDIEQILKTAAVGIQPHSPLVVRVSACRVFCRYFTATQVESIRGPLLGEHRVLASFGSLLRDADEEVLHLALESLALIVKLSPAAVAEGATSLAALVLDLWRRSKSDALAHLSVLDLVSSAASSHPLLRQALQETLLPAVAEDLQPGVEAYITAASIDLYGVLLKKAEVPFSGAVLSCAPPLIAAVLRSDESGLLQNACDALCCLVQRSPQQVSEIGLLEPAFRAVERLLSLDLDDNASLFAGPLVTLLMQRFGHQLPPELARALLRVLVIRLTRAELPFLIQSLTAVIARLLLEDFSGVLTALAAMEVQAPKSVLEAAGSCPVGRSALDVLLAMWMDRYDTMRSKHSRNVFYTALCRIHAAAAQDPRLQAAQTGGPPLAERVLSVIISGLEHETERNKRQAKGMLDGDSDDSEEEDDDDDGEACLGDEDDELFALSKGGKLLSELVDLDDSDEDLSDAEGGDTFQAVEREDPLYSLDLQQALVAHLVSPGLLLTAPATLSQRASAAVQEAVASKGGM